MATGKKISVPSDDPVVAARALKLRTDVSNVVQYQRNVDDAESWMDITEAAISNLNDILQRARELGVQAENSTNNSEDLQKISAEIKELRKQIVQIANSTYAGRYVFSGYSTDKKLMNDDGTFAIDALNSEKINYEISLGDDIDINVPGGELFDMGNSAVKGNKCRLIQVMDDFITALDNGDNGAVSNIVKDIDDCVDNLLRVRADIGARMNRLEFTRNRLESDYINFTELMSTNEDVDMAETIMNLKNEENVYRASLAGGARIIQTSLVDFLK